MTNVKHYIRVCNNNQGDEIGHIYQEMRGIVVPEGFVAYRDLHTNHQAIEVHPADEVVEISAEQYGRIEEDIIDGRDPSDIIAEVLTEVDANIAIDKRCLKSDEQRLREALDNFTRAALELADAWEIPDNIEAVEEAVGINVNYPFTEDFGEVVAKMRDWGVKDERSPLEKAVDYIESTEQHGYVRHLLEPTARYVDAVKMIMRILLMEIEHYSQRGEQEDAEEIAKINKLIDEL